MVFADLIPALTQGSFCKTKKDKKTKKTCKTKTRTRSKKHCGCR